MKRSRNVEQKPQQPADQHGPGYDNDVSTKSWLRNGDATSKPAFDQGNAWRGGKLRKD